jgi:hypothetical protein
LNHSLPAAGRQISDAQIDMKLYQFLTTPGSPVLSMNGTDLRDESMKSTEHQNCFKDSAHDKPFET